MTDRSMKPAQLRVGTIIRAESTIPADGGAAVGIGQVGSVFTATEHLTRVQWYADGGLGVVSDLVQRDRVTVLREPLEVSDLSPLEIRMAAAQLLR